MFWMKVIQLKIFHPRTVLEFNTRRGGARDIVIELDIDPDILGVNRVNGLKVMVKNEVRAEKGFRDLEHTGHISTTTQIQK